MILHHITLHTKILVLAITIKFNKLVLTLVKVRTYNNNNLYLRDRLTNPQTIKE